MADFLSYLLAALVILLPLANPLTTVVLFLSLSGNMPELERNKQALLTSLYVFIIIVAAFHGGQFIMNTFGISIPGLRIAGGMIISYLGFRMLFPVPDPVAKDLNQQPSSINIAFVPLAMPSTAGPGTIAMVITVASTLHNEQTGISTWMIDLLSVAVPLTLSIILWICLRSANLIIRVAGRNGIEAIGRFMGFLLICMGVQFVINGIREIVLQFPNI